MQEPGPAAPAHAESLTRRIGLLLVAAAIAVACSRLVYRPLLEPEASEYAAIATLFFLQGYVTVPQFMPGGQPVPMLSRRRFLNGALLGTLAVGLFYAVNTLWP